VSVPSVLYVAAAALYLGGTVDDLVTAPGKVRRYNRTLHDVAIVPVIRNDSSVLALTGRF